MRSSENGKLLNNLEVFSFPERKCTLLKAAPHKRISYFAENFK